MKTRVLAVLGLVAVVPCAQAAKEDVYAIVGARIVTVSGATHETGTIVLRDGVIEAVGTAVAVPPDARVLDGKGLTLTPGLIDGFGGLGLPAPPPGGDRGGAPRTPPPPPGNPLAPQAMALEKIRPADALKARDSGVTTALVIPRDGVVPGQSALIDLVGESAEAMAVRQPAALHVHMTALPRKYPGSLMGTVAYLRQSLYDAQRYRQLWAEWERAPRGRKRPRYDAALAAWQDVLAGREPLVVTAFLENDLRRALTVADEFKLRLVVAGAPKASREAGVFKARKLPLIVSVNFDPPKPPQFGDGVDEDKEKRDIDEAERNPAALAKAGVAFGLGSGYAESYLKGLQKAVERGLPRDAALKAATLDTAAALGVADRTGSLEVGKLANVVAWSGDPLAKEAKVKMVFVDGTLYEPDEKPAEKKDDKKEAGE